MSWFNDESWLAGVVPSSRTPGDDHPVPQNFWPRCARCCRPVDRVTVEHDVCRRVTVFVAHCHGEVETAELRDVDLVQGRVVDAVAFTGRTPPSRPERSGGDVDREMGKFTPPQPPPSGCFASVPPPSSPHSSLVSAGDVKQLSESALYGTIERSPPQERLAKALDRFQTALRDQWRLRLLELLRRRGG